MSALPLPRQKPSLPQQWADEMALASSTISSTSGIQPTPSPPETLGGPIFDRQLDGFLDRFQQEIIAARSLKDDLDHTPVSNDAAYHAKKQSFKLKMERIRSLFATEGEEFVLSLERRNPKLVMAACGENTIELAQGIERLESAVKEEETKRAAGKPPKPPPPTDVQTTPLGPGLAALQHAAHVASMDRAALLLSLPKPNGPASIGHTLNNLSSDETLQLMQSDIQALKLELMRLQRSKVASGNPYPTSLPSQPILSPESPGNSPFSVSSLTPEHKESNTGLPPSLLANNNVSVVRVTGRANGFQPTYVSHLEQMKSRLEALEKKPLSRRAKSAARLGRTQTMGSMYETHTMLGDENQNPNVSAMVTPPRGSRRIQHRSISTQSPLYHNPKTPPSAPRFRAVSSPSSTPSPTRHRTSGVPNGSPARLFFDGPEEMLSRPQSHAAARDMQRYSLKVARRLGPSEPMVVAEPRARSAVVVSPTKKANVAEHGGVGGSNALSEVGGGGGGGVGGPPSTIDTSGSGGRLVEEIEGDMWVRKGVVWKRWRRRYASIVSHQFFGKVMCLFSYDSNGGVISTRSQIVVLHSSLCRAVRDKVDIGGQERFIFVLRTSSKEYHFAAESDEIRRNWIRELRDAARKDNSRLVHTTGRSMTFRKR